MRMTIGMGVKPLFVSYADHYSFVHRTTIGLSANDYYSEPYPQELHASAYEVITLSAALKRGGSSEKYILTISHLDTDRATDDIP